MHARIHARARARCRRCHHAAPGTPGALVATPRVQFSCHADFRAAALAKAHARNTCVQLTWRPRRYSPVVQILVPQLSPKHVLAFRVYDQDMLGSDDVMGEYDIVLDKKSDASDNAFLRSGEETQLTLNMLPEKGTQARLWPRLSGPGLHSDARTAAGEGRAGAPLATLLLAPLLSFDMCRRRARRRAAGNVHQEWVRLAVREAHARVSTGVVACHCVSGTARATRARVQARQRGTPAGEIHCLVQYTPFFNAAVRAARALADADLTRSPPCAGGRMQCCACALLGGVPARAGAACRQHRRRWAELCLAVRAGRRRRVGRRRQGRPRQGDGGAAGAHSPGDASTSIWRPFLHLPI
jgi:hypothetical protein